MNEERFDEHRLDRALERDDEAFLGASRAVCRAHRSIDKDGRAIGVVCTSSESENIKDYDGPHTHLMRSLPRWMTPLR
jgi:hypothetical protein